jgi:hypothetical protein
MARTSPGQPTSDDDGLRGARTEQHTCPSAQAPASCLTGGALYLWQWSPLATVDQHIAAATAALTAGALVIAVGAGAIALLAYRDASLRPRLQLTAGATGGQFSTIDISLTNDGSVSAQFAIVWLQFAGDVGVSNAPHWTIQPTGGLRWEAPAGVVIHPKAPAYTLPSVTLRTPDGHFKVHTYRRRRWLPPVKGNQLDV